MNFKPLTEREIADQRLWAQGDYRFQIVDAEERVSQRGGNPMFQLKLEISRPDGTTRTAVA